MSPFALSRRLSTAAMVALLTGSCASTTEDPLTTTTGSSGRTLLGTPLREPAFSAEVRARLEEDLAIAMEHHFHGEREDADRMWLDIENDSAQGFWPAGADILFAREAAGS